MDEIHPFQVPNLGETSPNSGICRGSKEFPPWAGKFDVDCFLKENGQYVRMIILTEDSLFKLRVAIWIRNVLLGVRIIRVHTVSKSRTMQRMNVNDAVWHKTFGWFQQFVF